MDDGGIDWHESQACNDNPCDEEWACCYTDCDSCIDTTWAECDYTWIEFSKCSSNPCGEPGACCFKDNCVDTLNSCQCWDFGGDFYGEGTDCDTVSCNYVWGCYDPDCTSGNCTRECGQMTCPDDPCDSIGSCYCCGECSVEHPCIDRPGCCQHCWGDDNCTLSTNYHIQDCRDDCWDDKNCIYWNWRDTCYGSFDCGDAFNGCDGCPNQPDGGTRSADLPPGAIGGSGSESQKESSSQKEERKRRRKTNLKLVSSHKFDCSRECIAAGCECDCIKTLNGVVCLE